MAQMRSTDQIFISDNLDMDPVSDSRRRKGVFVLSWKAVGLWIVFFVLSLCFVGIAVYLATVAKKNSSTILKLEGVETEPYTGPQTETDLFLQRGDNTLKVPLALFALNRKRLCDSLIGAGVENGSVVFMEGGKGENRYNTDMGVLFRQESYFAWAFGVEEPNFYGAIDVKNGCKSYLFIEELHWSYIIWLGKINGPGHFKNKYGVDEVYYNKNITKILHGSKQLLVLAGQNTDSKTWFKEPYFEGIDTFNVENETLFSVINELRVIKTDFELQVLRYTAKISSDAHKAMMKAVRAGMFEYQMESIFLHHTYYRGGMRYVSYPSIAASGPNAAVLHYGHSAEPNDRKLEKGDLCLFDMGAEYYCYGTDITTTFPVGGKFNEKQKIIYNAVLKANRAVHKHSKPGIWWVDMHKLAERTILTELKAAGLVRGEVDDMMKHRVGYIFMPHGLGHLLGLDVHDPGGYPKGEPERSKEDGLNKLRTARHLKKGMVLTNEPACYFIDYLLDEGLKHENRSRFLVEDEINKYRGMGGVRIEDVTLITEDGAEDLNDVPRTIEEIEQFMET